MKPTRVLPLVTAAVLVLPCRGPAEAKEDLPAAPKGFDVRREGVARGKVETVTYDSRTVGARRPLVVYTPPGYTKDRKYPVLYLLHGARYNETSWVKDGAADAILDNLAAEKKITPFILALPNGFARTKGKGRRAGGNRFEDDLLTDLLPYVEAHTPSGRAARTAPWRGSRWAAARRWPSAGSTRTPSPGSAASPRPCPAGRPKPARTRSPRPGSSACSGSRAGTRTHCWSR